MFSPSNQIKGTIKSVKVDGLWAEIVISTGNLEIASLICSSSVQKMNLKTGDKATAVIKAAEVMVAKD